MIAKTSRHADTGSGAAFMLNGWPKEEVCTLAHNVHLWVNSRTLIRPTSEETDVLMYYLNVL